MVSVRYRRWLVFFGFAEVLSVIYSLDQEQNVLAMEKTKVSLKEVL